MRARNSRDWLSIRSIVIAGLILCLLPAGIGRGFQSRKGGIQGVVLRGNTAVPATGVRVAVFVGVGDFAAVGERVERETKRENRKKRLPARWRAFARAHGDIALAIAQPLARREV